MDSKREFEKNIKRRIIKARKNIEKKYMLLKRGEADLNENLNTLYKPIIDVISKQNNKSDDGVEKIEIKPIKTEENFSLFEDSNVDITPILGIKNFNNFTYGIRMEDGHLKIGNQHIDVNGDELDVKEKKFQITTGLRELLTRKRPANIYSKSDLNAYREILLLTNAHLKDYQSGNEIEAGNNFQYKSIVSKLFANHKGGEVQYKNYEFKNIIYYDDINELVDRLRLLHAEKQAGNNSVDNEILSICEELREIGLIK